MVRVCFCVCRYLLEWQECFDLKFLDWFILADRILIHWKIKRKKMEKTGNLLYISCRVTEYQVFHF